MNYVRVIEGVVTPYTRRQLKQDNPQVSFPSELSAELMAQFNMYEFVNTQLPEFDATTHKVISAESELVNGKYEQRWQVVALTAEELALRAAQQQQSPENIRALLEALGRIATRNMILQDELTPEEVEILTDLYEQFVVGETVYGPNDPNGKPQTIRRYENVLYKAATSHTTQADWTPPTVPALWTPVVATGVIPVWVQPLGSQDDYAIGEQVTHNGNLWESNVDNNVWEPGVYGWTDLGAV